EQNRKVAVMLIDLQECFKLFDNVVYSLVNLDCTLILARPKIWPNAASIRARIAELLKVSTDVIGIKAKTPEGMGTENAAIAHVVVLLEKNKPKQSRSKSDKPTTVAAKRS